MSNAPLASSVVFGIIKVVTSFNGFIVIVLQCYQYLPPCLRAFDIKGLRYLPVHLTKTAASGCRNVGPATNKRLLFPTTTTITCTMSQATADRLIHCLGSSSLEAPIVRLETLRLDCTYVHACIKRRARITGHIRWMILVIVDLGYLKNLVIAGFIHALTPRQDQLCHSRCSTRGLLASSVLGWSWVFLRLLLVSIPLGFKQILLYASYHKSELWSLHRSRRSRVPLAALDGSDSRSVGS